MQEKDDFGLVPRPSSAIQAEQPRAKRIMERIVEDALTLAKDAHPTKPRLTVLLAKDEFISEGMEIILRWKLEGQRDLNFMYFDRATQLVQLTEAHDFDLIMFYLGTITWDIGRGHWALGYGNWHLNIYEPIVEFLGNLKSRYGKPIWVTQGLDLTQRFADVGVTFAPAPYAISDLESVWKSCGPAGGSRRPPQDPFRIAVCGFNPDRQLVQGLLGFHLEDLSPEHTLQCFDFTHTDHLLGMLRFWRFDLILLLLNPCLHDSWGVNVVEPHELVAELKAILHAPIIIWTNEKEYPLNAAASFSEVGADAYLSMETLGTPWAKSLMKSAVMGCVEKSGAWRSPASAVPGEGL